LPADNAGPTLWARVLSGELNGVMAQITPSGMRTVNPSRSLTPRPAVIGIRSPASRLASSPDSSRVWAQRRTSFSLSARVKPASSRSRSMNCRMRLSMIRAAPVRAW